MAVAATSADRSTVLSWSRCTHAIRSEEMQLQADVNHTCSSVLITHLAGAAPSDCTFIIRARSWAMLSAMLLRLSCGSAMAQLRMHPRSDVLQVFVGSVRLMIATSDGTVRACSNASTTAPQRVRLRTQFAASSGEQFEVDFMHIVLECSLVACTPERSSLRNNSLSLGALKFCEHREHRLRP
jgi:hypothetical protein